MRAAVFLSPHHLTLTERPRPEASAEDDVLVEVEACGICGTDLHVLEDPPGHPGTPGVTMGHEFVGRVVEIGGAVRRVSAGDRVVIQANMQCNACEMCAEGYFNQCERMTTNGIFRDGGLAEFAVIPERGVHPIPDHLPAEVAALIEPLSCVVHGVRLLGLTPGEDAIVLGAGPIGLLFTAVFAANGARSITCVELSPERAALAHRMGATQVLTPGEYRERGRQAQVVVDAVGMLLPAAIDAARPGGRIALFGMNSQVAPPVKQFDITRKELTVIGTYVGSSSYPQAIALLDSGRLDLSPMITSVLPLEQTNEGLDRLRAGTEVKVIVQPRL
ncbi:alcohol dehydrogenase catalytic domain-containing protein [Leucobacter weissii]|uniref:Alcohol dehydrogenase catalytic domain-containing protein n=1 Tax=Leucobacter weissii TaxID=1983706 RepID=A0A939S813_9MICO|nr:alcohol dehydrogenase catalytic domain-containing protein [Leucobacter weissii]MBO1901556.1 alcohol dehydrogenase catalytic domain-containing protein [Leucobacter weissii]